MKTIGPVVVKMKIKVKISLFNIIKLKLIGFPISDYVEIIKEDKK